MSDFQPSRRHAWTDRPAGGASELLALPDDELLYRIEALPPEHELDGALLEVVKSQRHFFVRQEAAKRVRQTHLLKELAGDRHIGQILVRGMTRTEDVGYLEKLLVESRHLEVRKAAEAQLRLIRGAEASASPTSS